VGLDGSPWECCPRDFLRRTLAELESQLGAHVMASFEHEFQLLETGPPALAFSLEAQRRSEPFAAEVMAALAQAGVEPERFFPEYAPHQYEIPLAPSLGMQSADRSVIFREVVRELARRHGLRASFVPLLDPEQAGNGVHIHLNLLDARGRSLLYDQTRPGCLSEVGSQFAAGVIRHARALSAITAPSPVSGARLQPHRWSAGAVCLAQGNREALLRIPPLVTLGGGEPEHQLHLEYRAADAAANPHLALGALLRAGMSGVAEKLPAPAMLDRDPAELTPEDAQRFGVGALPQTLAEALQALAQDELVRTWFTGLMYEAYVSVKQSEASATDGVELEEICRRYAAIY
jgi:glutamine synthetase